MDLNKIFTSNFTSAFKARGILLIAIFIVSAGLPEPASSQNLKINRSKNTMKDLQIREMPLRNAETAPEKQATPSKYEEITPYKQIQAMPSQDAETALQKGAHPAPFQIAETTSQKGEWTALFNGKNLDGWTPKFAGHALGVNYNNTFRVEDGLLTVSYDEWGPFDGEFGHMFYETPYSHYRIRATYRFVGEQVENGPGWAIRNNGLMLHCQNPETMPEDQDFPVSVEVQLLGGNGTDERTTANLCTPGTNVVMGDSLFTPHCTNSNSKTYHGDQWVTVEVEVKGDEIIEHYVNGEKVMQYTKPQYDKQDETAQPLISGDGENLLIESGYIAIQAESAPTQFKSIEILELEE